MANRKYRTIESDFFGHKVTGKGINSREKGAVNERVCAGVISKWTGVDFIRTPASGGLRLSNNSTVCGDITCGDEDFSFLFIIETKHLNNTQKNGQHAGIKLLGDLPIRSAVRTIWEKQLLEDVKRTKNKLPMMLLRVNEMPKGEYVVYLQSGFTKLLRYKEVAIVATHLQASIVGVMATSLFSRISYEEIAIFATEQNLLSHGS